MGVAHVLPSASERVMVGSVPTGGGGGSGRPPYFFASPPPCLAGTPRYRPPPTTIPLTLPEYDATCGVPGYETLTGVEECIVCLRTKLSSMNWLCGSVHDIISLCEQVCSHDIISLRESCFHACTRSTSLGWAVTWRFHPFTLGIPSIPGAFKTRFFSRFS